MIGPISLITSNWMLEVLARTEGIIKHREAPTSYKPINYSTKQSSNYSTKTIHLKLSIKTVSNNVYDFSTLFSTFSGRKARILSKFVSCLYLFSMLLLTSVIFGKTTGRCKYLNNNFSLKSPINSLFPNTSPIPVFYHPFWKVQPVTTFLTFQLVHIIIGQVYSFSFLLWCQWFGWI